jgi:hypothetical protein
MNIFLKSLKRFTFRNNPLTYYYFLFFSNFFCFNFCFIAKKINLNGSEYFEMNSENYSVDKKDCLIKLMLHVAYPSNDRIFFRIYIQTHCI